MALISNDKQQPNVDDKLFLFFFFCHKVKVILKSGLCRNKLVPMFTFLYVLAFSTLMFMCINSSMPSYEAKKHLLHPNVVSVF